MRLRPRKRPSRKVPPLPRSVVTKDRQVVRTDGALWRFRASSDGGKLITLDWRLLAKDLPSIPIDDRAVAIFKLYLIRKFEFSKGSTISNDYATLRRLLRWISKVISNKQLTTFSWATLTHTLFIRFLEHGMTTGEKGNAFSRLRKFYCWGAFVGHFEEFDRQLASSLKETRAKGNVKGAAVRSHHPTKGPLNSEERDLISRAIKARRGRGDDRIVVMTFLELGANPQSVARLREKDLQNFSVNVVNGRTSEKVTRYQVLLPRVKKRKEHRETVPRPISKELGKELKRCTTGNSDGFLLHWVNPNDPEREFARRMQRWAREVRIISPRTREIIHLSPRRFRCTVGTEMARLGAARIKIAAALDHTDDQNVDPYVEASSYVLDQIGPRFDEFFEPVARAS